MVDNWLLVQLVDRVRGERGVEPEDYRIPDLSIVLDELAGKKMIRRVIYLCLGQQLFSDASVVFFLMTNPLDLHVFEEKEEIVEGLLVCSECGRWYIYRANLS